jgi:hypothetical protein
MQSFLLYSKYNNDLFIYFKFSFILISSLYYSLRVNSERSHIDTSKIAQMFADEYLKSFTNNNSTTVEIVKQITSKLY